MNTLHIVSKTGQPFSLCLRTLRSNDAIIFIEDGVYNLPEMTFQNIQVKQPAFALLDDCYARGLDISDKPANGISVDQFVTLTEQYSKTLSWF